MEREIDVSARHLLKWLKAGPPGVEVRATREFVWDGAPVAAEELDTEDELEVATTVGLLEVRPAHGHAWMLRLRVENPLACHLPEDGSVSDEPEEIDLDDFEACFLDEDGDASVTVEADNRADARAFDKVLSAILASGS
jgi:hypothetical protein